MRAFTLQHRSLITKGRATHFSACRLGWVGVDQHFSAHGPLTKGRVTHFSACRLGWVGVDQHFSAHGPLTKGRVTHFSACRLRGEGGVDHYFSAHGTETGQALSFIPYRAAPASRWQAASDWREGLVSRASLHSSPDIYISWADHTDSTVQQNLCRLPRGTSNYKPVFLLTFDWALTQKVLNTL